MLALGGVAGIFLLCRAQRWWLYVLPIVVVVAAAAAWLIGDVGGERLFAKPLNTPDDVWIAVGLSAVGLAAGSWYRSTWRRKIIAVLAAVMVVIAAGNQINRSYVQFPAVRDLFGVPTADQVSGLPAVSPVPTAAPTSTFPAGPLTVTWIPVGPGIPADGRGKISSFTIPNTRSGFNARPGWVYLPAAYFAQNPQPLPVLMLLHGQPGSPDDWLKGDRVQTLMNDFASHHHGIAPIVVMPDVLGSELANPLCADTTLGAVDSYLSLDVPTAIRTQLRVDPNPRHWVIAGFSYGGTCSLQMATNHPGIYPNFIDIAGQPEPTLGSGTAGRKQTVDTAFGGDPAKFTAINPADLLASRSYPTSAGWFLWGATDPDTKTGQQQLFAAAQKAGMTVQQWEVPVTGHDWDTATAALTHTIPWIATQTGLTN
jgi:S-formylglutathione hydrolase FrmB